MTTDEQSLATRGWLVKPSNAIDMCITIRRHGIDYSVPLRRIGDVYDMDVSGLPDDWREACRFGWPISIDNDKYPVEDPEAALEYLRMMEETLDEASDPQPSQDNSIHSFDI